jgi:membrane protease YdiL (CAAX protease family)
METAAPGLMLSLHRRIIAFFVVAYALSWFGWLGNWLWPGLPIWPLPNNPFGPIIAAPLVIRYTEGRAGLRRWLERLARFRAPLWVYAVALLFPLVIVLASVGLAAASGAATQPLPERELLEFVILVPLLLLLGPIEEEPAFRGYGLHELQQTMSPLAASVWIGIGVLVWHAPILAIGAIPWPFAITIVAVSVVYGWLYQLGRSLWPLVTLHFSVNYFGGEYFGSIIAPSGQVLYSIYFCLFFLVWVAFIVWRHGSELGKIGAERLGWAGLPDPG